MATAVARTQGEADGDLTFAFGDLPRAVTLDGSASFDEVGGAPVTAYAWTLIDSPPTSTAVLDDAASETPSFTADLPGTYLFFLQVTAGGQDSESVLEDAPASAFARVTATSQNLALVYPANKERGWTDRANGNLVVLDVIGGQVSALEAADGVQDTSIAANAAAISALQGGGQTRHHVLNPSELDGPNDYAWDADDVAAGHLSSDNGGTRTVWAGIDADGVLQVDIGVADDYRVAGFMVDGVAGEFRAVCDLRLSIEGAIDAKDPLYLCMGFGWIDNKDFSVNRDLRGAGLVVENGALNAVGFGPARAAPLDLNGLLQTVLDPEVDTSMLVTELVVRITRTDSEMYPEVSVGGGGWVRCAGATWDDAADAAGNFIIFGMLKHATAGLRIKSTGLRFAPAETWFGS